MPSTLIPLAPGAEEIETFTVADVLVRAGMDVTVAAIADPAPRGGRGLPLGSDRPLSAVDEAGFDLVYLPGGMGSAEACRDDPAVQGIIARRLDERRLLAVICATPIALLPRDLARGRRLTCYPALREKLVAGGAEWIDAPVVRDGCLLTSQGPGTAMVLAFRLATLLAGRERAAGVAEAMLVRDVDLDGDDG